MSNIDVLLKWKIFAILGRGASDEDDDGKSDDDLSMPCYYDSDDSADDDLDTRVPLGQWPFASQSRRASQLLGDLPRRVSAGNNFKLENNASDEVLLEKAKIEIRHSLSQVRKSVFGADRKQEIDPAVALAGNLPKQFVEVFYKWLKSGCETASQSSASPRRSPRCHVAKQSKDIGVTFSDVIEFIRCELTMQHLK